jgi:hypothetical protein
MRGGLGHGLSISVRIVHHPPAVNCETCRRGKKFRWHNVLALLKSSLQKFCFSMPFFFNIAAALEKANKILSFWRGALS